MNENEIANEASTSEIVSQTIQEITSDETDQTASDTPSWLEEFADYKDYLTQIKNQYQINERDFLRQLIQVQQVYQQNPRAFTAVLIKEHFPQLINELREFIAWKQQQLNSQQPQQTPQIDDDELDEVDKQIYQTIKQLQDKLTQYEQQQQMYQQYLLEQQTNYYLGQLEKLAQRLPALRDPNIAPKIGALTQQIMTTGIETDFEKAVERAYNAVVPQTKPDLAKPLKPVNEPLKIETAEADSTADVIRKVMRAMI